MSRLEFEQNNPLESYYIKQELVERLSRGSKRITWIWGDTGHGKTVLASLVFSQLKEEAEWVDVEQSRNDIESVRQYCEQLIGHGGEARLRTLFLDNAHLMGPALLDLCQWWLETMQTDRRLFIISQRAIDAEYASLVASDAIEEVPPELLLFTLNESSALCKQYGKDVDKEFIRVHRDYHGLPMAIAASLMASKDNKVALPSQTFLRAAQWEESEGNTLLALALYVKAKRLDQFAHLFLGNARHWFASGQRDKIGDVLSLITDDEKNQYPWCWVWQSLLVLPFEPDESRRLAEHAFQLFRKANDINGMYMSISQALLTYLVKLSDFGDIRALLYELDRFDSDENYARLDSHAQSSASYIIFFCMFVVMPENRSLAKWEERTLSVLVSETEIVSKLKIQVLVQKAYFYRGDNYKIHPLETLKEAGNDKPVQPYDIINFNLARIQEGWCLGRFDEIKQLYQQSREVTAAHNMQANIGHTSLQVVIALLLNGELEEAQKEIYQLLDFIPRRMTALLHHLYVLEAWRLVLLEEPVLAMSTAQQCSEISRESCCTAYIGFSYIVEAYTLAQAGEWSPALEKLAELKQQPHLQHYEIFGFHENLLSAYISSNQNDRNRARKYACLALQFAARKNLMYFIWSVPEVLALNVSLALESGIEEHFCMKMIARLGLTAPPHARSENSWAWSVKIKTLGHFDTNIQALTKSGKSRRIQLSILYLAIIHGGTGIPLETLCDTLWPDEDSSEARHKLDNALYRLRQILGKQSLAIVNNRIKLDETTIWVDVLCVLELIRTCHKQLHKPSDSQRIKDLLLEILDLYQGEFLEGVFELEFEISNFRIYVSNQVRALLTSAYDYFTRQNDLEYMHMIRAHPLLAEDTDPPLKAENE